MITLGIDCSSRQGSLALLKDGALVGETSWIADRVRHNTIFQALDALVGPVGYASIDRFAVGRGPGSFSGMRMSLAIAQALALSGGKEVRAISSGAALARAVAREGAERIAVVGDARRGQVWIGQFEARSAAELELVDDWALRPYDAVNVADGAVVVSPEAERLARLFPSIGAARFPHAREVAELAERQSEPLEPLYMHPPVFVEPKFPARSPVEKKG